MKVEDMDAWRRLAREVVRRRSELRMTQSDVQTYGGPSLGTMQSIEAARQDSYRDVTLVQLEDALFWERGSVERVLVHGEEPTNTVGDPTRRFRERQQRRAGDRPGGSVGGGTDDGAYVADRHPQDRQAAGLSDDEVLALIRENRRLADELERRIKGDGPVGGA